MKIVARHPNFKLPTRGSTGAGGYDIYMPERGRLVSNVEEKIMLGFSAKVPEGWAALLMPRSGWGGRGLELMNTTGLIDSDYTGEWIAKVRDKTGRGMQWEAGERVLQYILVPAGLFDPVLVDSLEETERGEGGFGSTDK